MHHHLTAVAVGNVKKQFHSANRHRILLSVVQVLTDLELAISKAYISSDGGWFMDGMYAAPHAIFTLSKS